MLPVRAEQVSRNSVEHLLVFSDSGSQLIGPVLQQRDPTGVGRDVRRQDLRFVPLHSGTIQDLYFSKFGVGLTSVLKWYHGSTS